jgi:membrane complex biogenesis BtpA family protein
MGKFLELLDSGKNPLIGMVHLGGLPGSVHYNEPWEAVEDRAVAEARTLNTAGFDGILIQNTGDVPAIEEGDEATVAFMTAIGLRIKKEAPDTFLGVNVLMNGSKAALAVAKAIGADFVRIKINTGVVSTSTGLVQADPHEVLSFRNRINAKDIDMVGDLYDRTAAPVGEFPLAILGDLAIRHADIKALVVSGYNYKDLINRIHTLKEKLPAAKIIVGGGAKASNIEELIEISDGVIVGSSIKTGGGFLDPIDPQKAQTFVKTADQFR